ncbi:hypothetical protein DJ82_12750 [Halorubrum sp. Ib24]|uniref:HalOD1 output domain-containing protein n=1 Tax=Halorubrum sp. Ib24 TaxID=1383850 RepID=UPI000BD9E6FE|nr:HalOD1 output domain-containing protein [Halorubrum sp. Ib24]OYR38138.1 hypothetical protein DJ82_12750 [Halorubrum sp. Ib24]
MDTQNTPDETAPVYKVDLNEANDRSTSQIVVESIADLTDREPEDLEPLWDYVDPEALNSFVAHAADASTPCRLAFRYQGYTVEIVENRWLRLVPDGDGSSSTNA